MLAGDGIGPEITQATLDVLRAVDARCALGLQFEAMAIGFASLKASGSTCPAAVMQRIPEVDGVILGPVSNADYPPHDQGGINPSGAIRVAFELGANIRPCRSRAGLTILRAPMDLIVVRECTEGFYADRNMYAGLPEFMPDQDTALSVRKISSKACRRVAHAAFQIARQRRRKVTAVHKANVLKMSDGLFLREIRDVAREYPEVALDDLLVDSTAALLVRTPDRFDVMVTTNLYGDILSDEASELCGGLGLAGSINASEKICVAQAQHGSAPDIQGQNIANPTALMLSAAMLMAWRGRRDGNERLIEAATIVECAIDKVIGNPACRTRDLKGEVNTDSFARIVCDLVTTKS